MNRPDWAVLGIEPTGDVRAIRRAYATQLKRTHPEDDPQGFQALRLAYEQALARAEHAAKPIEDEAAEKPAETPAEAPTTQPATPPPAEAPRPNPWQESASPQRMLESLARAIEGGNAEHMRRELGAILAMREQWDIGTGERMEADVARLLVENIPATDPLVAPAAEGFGWEFGHRIPAGAGGILQRRFDLDEAARLDDPAHDLHKGWQLLTRPGGGLQRRFASLRSRLVSQIRAILHQWAPENPAIAAQLQPEAAVWWEKFISRPRFTLESLLLILPCAAIWMVTAVVYENETSFGDILFFCTPFMPWIYLGLRRLGHMWLSRGFPEIVFRSVAWVVAAGISAASLWAMATAGSSADANMLAYVVGLLLAALIVFIPERHAEAEQPSAKMIFGLLVRPGAMLILFGRSLSGPGFVAVLLILVLLLTLQVRGQRLVNEMTALVPARLQPWLPLFLIAATGGYAMYLGISGTADVMAMLMIATMLAMALVPLAQSPSPRLQSILHLVIWLVAVFSLLGVEMTDTPAPPTPAAEAPPIPPA